MSSQDAGDLHRAARASCLRDHPAHSLCRAVAAGTRECQPCRCRPTTCCPVASGCRPLQLERRGPSGGPCSRP
eukprot:1293240-Pyramimonas_sp.AAC.2